METQTLNEHLSSLHKAPTVTGQRPMNPAEPKPIEIISQTTPNWQTNMSNQRHHNRL